VGVGKQAFYKQLEMPTEQAYAYTREVMSFNATFADAQEGMCAFLEKRNPEWKGRERRKFRLWAKRSNDDGHHHTASGEKRAEDEGAATLQRRSARRQRSQLRVR